MSSAKRTIRVLESVGAIKPTTNPYLAMLVDALRERDDVEVSFFSFPAALFSRYDVFHVHWPEVLFGGHRPVGRLARRTLTTMVALRLTLTRTPIVRTWHNTERPSGLSRWDHRLLDWFERLTRARIRLNSLTEVPEGAPVITIPLGHYCDWYRDRARSDAQVARVAYVGLIRRYKGVEDLVGAFRAVSTPGASLHISGKASSVELEASIAELAGDDDRISLRYGFLDDDDFVQEVTAAQLVALPFVHMHNSSTVITALSLGRPVLVPDNEVNRALASEFGARWMHLYSGGLTGEDIDAALTSIANDPAPTDPDFEGRDWQTAAALHLRAFQAALGDIDAAGASVETLRPA